MPMLQTPPTTYSFSAITAPRPSLTTPLQILLPKLRTSHWNPLSRLPHFGPLSNICVPFGGGLGGLLEHVLVISADNGRNCVAGSYYVGLFGPCLTVLRGKEESKRYRRLVSAVGRKWLMRLSSTIMSDRR